MVSGVFFEFGFKLLSITLTNFKTNQKFCSQRVVAVSSNIHPFANGFFMMYSIKRLHFVNSFLNKEFLILTLDKTFQQMIPQYMIFGVLKSLFEFMLISVTKINFMANQEFFLQRVLFVKNMFKVGNPVVKTYYCYGSYIYYVHKKCPTF